LAVVSACLFALRQETGSWRSILSRSYWVARHERHDLYRPADALFKRGTEQARSVAITIDDGPYPETTEKILEALAKADARVTFFVVGARVDERPDLVRRMLADRHEVGNHTMNHPRLDELPLDAVGWEILECALAVREAGGVEMTLFRPPGMRASPEVLSLARSLGYTTVWWNVGAKDFTGLTPEGLRLEPDPSEITQSVLANVKPGSIVLLHDTPATAKALPAILRGLQARGFQIRTVSEMMGELPRPVYVKANPPARDTVAQGAKPKRKPSRAKTSNGQTAPEPEHDDPTHEEESPTTARLLGDAVA
jgi:peptidoglycan-N-acetylglucosamine deacetylase